MKPRIIALAAAATLALPALAAHVATVIGVTNAPASAVTLATNSAYRVRVWPLRLDAFNWTKVYTEKNRFRVPNTLRALGGRATELRFEAIDSTYNCDRRRDSRPEGSRRQISGYHAPWSPSHSAK